jgi:hypothetical protein
LPECCICNSAITYKLRLSNWGKWRQALQRQQASRGIHRRRQPERTPQQPVPHAMAADAGARASESLAAAGGGELAAAAAAASTASAGASAAFAALRRIGRIRSRNHTGAYSGLLATGAGDAL